MLKKLLKKTPKPAAAAASTSTAAVEDIPHKPQALICHRCGDDIAPDTDREHGPQGVSHHLATCFENVKAERDELRAVIAGSHQADKKGKK